MKAGPKLRSSPHAARTPHGVNTFTGFPARLASATAFAVPLLRPSQKARSSSTLACRHAHRLVGGRRGSAARSCLFTRDPS